MKKSLLAFSLTLAACQATPPAVVPQNPERAKGLPESPAELISFADRLLPQRASAPDPGFLEADRALAALEKARLRGPDSLFEVIWRLARASFYASGAAQDKKFKLNYAAQGQQFARQAAAEMPGRVEGHYYLALNLALEAEARTSLKLLKKVIEEAERAARYDSSFHEAGPLRLLGKIYLSAPAWPVSVGSSEKGVEALEEAVKLAPVPINLVFLGEAYFLDDQPEKAADYLQRGLKASVKGGLDPKWYKEAEDYLRRLDRSR